MCWKEDDLVIIIDHRLVLVMSRLVAFCVCVCVCARTEEDGVGVGVCSGDGRREIR